MDILWLLLCSVLVLLMQPGFCALESGLVRSKNGINVAMKNLADLCVSGVLFWLVGFQLMFGDSWGGWIGMGFPDSTSWTSHHLALLFYQVTFCGTAVTIISGAVAERISFSGYLWIAVITSVLIYPVTGHWIWGGMFSSIGSLGWLESRGFIDFAGSTVVHSVGGWVALSAVIILGPRLGCFSSKRPPMSGHNYLVSSLGVLLIMIGWFGFNGGGAYQQVDLMPRIFINTFLGGVSGGLAALVFSPLWFNFSDLRAFLFAILGGLVSITASAHLLTPDMAALCGFIGGLITLVIGQVLHRLELDDVSGAVSVHAGAGVWGTLAVALMTSPHLWDNGLTRWQQFQVQLSGVVTVAVYSVGVSLLVLGFVNFFKPLRVSHKTEVYGLNLVEHQIVTESDELLIHINKRRRHPEYHKPLSLNPFTAMGQVGLAYNLLLQQVKKEASNLRLARQALSLSEQRAIMARDATERKHQELLKKHKELSSFNKMMVDREVRMRELKRQINQLQSSLGEPEEYDLESHTENLIGKDDESRS